MPGCSVRLAPASTQRCIPDTNSPLHSRFMEPPQAVGVKVRGLEFTAKQFSIILGEAGPRSKQPSGVKVERPEHFCIGHNHVPEQSSSLQNTRVRQNEMVGLSAFVL